MLDNNYDSYNNIINKFYNYVISHNKDKYQLDIVRVNSATGVVDGVDNTHLEIGNDDQKIGVKVTNKWTGAAATELAGKTIKFAIHGVTYEKTIGSNGVSGTIGFNLVNPNDAVVIAKMAASETGGLKLLDAKLVNNLKV